MICKKAYPRVSIAGNPSDGFWGKCVSMTFFNYSAYCNISHSEAFAIKNGQYLLDFNHIKDLGYLFPLSNPQPKIEKNKLALAAIKTFFDFCSLNNIGYEKKVFNIIYGSNIPFSLGFSGSTAISISILKALDEFYNTSICDTDVESMALHAETHELGRYAGPQDPLAVNRKSCTYMNFNKEGYFGEAWGRNLSSLEKAIVHADYSSSDAYISNRTVKENGYLRNTVMPKIEKLRITDAPFFIITRENGSDSSIELSPSIKAYKNKDLRIIDGMDRISLLADEAREAIISNDFIWLGEVMNENFRLSIKYFDNDYLGKENIKFVQKVIETGAYAKFPGSGGAVFGLYPSEKVFNDLKEKFLDCKVEKLKIAENYSD
jgi:glucuronokinase